MTLKDRVKELAAKRGISLPALESELGFGNSTIVKWDKSTPNAEKLNAVAKYFDVTMDYLLNGSMPISLSQKDERDISKDLDSVMSKLQNKDDGPLNYDGVELDDETIVLLRDAIDLGLRQVKIRNKEKYTPNKYKK